MRKLFRFKRLRRGGRSRVGNAALFVVMIALSVLMIALPWLAPQLSKVVYVISDLAIVIGALAGFQWLAGRNTLTNVEALAGMMFLGWFIIFSRQIAAIESDRMQTQLILAQTKRPESVEDIAEVSETVPGTVSRLSSEV